MIEEPDDSGRRMGLVRATGVGVGAIVGGGVLALAGVAFATTGPGAILAFALNGVIALLTVYSFATLATRFPESGGTYIYAKKIMGVEAAFMIGWVVWFASIAAAVLYALGFGAYTLAGIRRLAQRTPGWVTWFAEHPWTLVLLAIVATATYTSILLRRATGGGEWSTVGKVIVFAVLIAGGCWMVARQPIAVTTGNLQPFLPNGGLGLLQAMGYTFIALQGYDLIAAVAGEVREPQRVLPRAMYLSLGLALAVYLPFLFVITTVGVAPGENVQVASLADSATFVARAAENFLGPSGTWLVIVAAVLSMLSALHANLMASSRIAFAMAKDRTLSAQLDAVDLRTGVPRMALLATALLVALIVVVIPNVSAAGAASSLIFLISFSLVHLMSLLALRRRGETKGRLDRREIPSLLGLFACVGLALFQGIAVPSAGVLTLIWLAAGSLLYFVLFARRARVVDASTEALDPSLTRLRGRAPLVLVPIARPASARAMVEVANALTPPGIGRVLLFSVVRPPDEWREGEPPRQLIDAQQVVGHSLTASFAASLAPQALISVSREPWAEIARVARTYGCESLLLGLGSLDEATGSAVEGFIGSVGADVVVLRAAPDWSVAAVQRVLVPVGGRRDHSELRARLLGSLSREGVREIKYLRVMPPDTPAHEVDRARAGLRSLAQDEFNGPLAVEIALSADFEDEIIRRATQADLVVLGLRRLGRKRRVFGHIAPRVAASTDCAMILISRA